MPVRCDNVNWKFLLRFPLLWLRVQPEILSNVICEGSSRTWKSVMVFTWWCCDHPCWFKPIRRVVDRVSLLFLQRSVWLLTKNGAFYFFMGCINLCFLAPPTFFWVVNQKREKNQQKVRLIICQQWQCHVSFVNDSLLYGKVFCTNNFMIGPCWLVLYGRTANEFLCFYK